jgi:hypothetical protein
MSLLGNDLRNPIADKLVVRDAHARTLRRGRTDHYRTRRIPAAGGAHGAAIWVVGNSSAITGRCTQIRSLCTPAMPGSAEKSALSNTHSYALTCMLTHVLRVGRNSPRCVARRCRCPQGRSQIAESEWVWEYISRV